MKTSLIIIILFAAIHGLTGQQFIPLWPEGRMPNSKGLKLEHEEERQRITRVAIPGMYAYFTSAEENKRSAVLICPSGGYRKLTYNMSGFQFAKWLNTIGINAFVLIYRLPTEPDLLEREKGPVQDAQRAMKIIRDNADLWDLDTSMIGIMGASAGGHLASTIGTHTEDFSAIGDSLDNIDFGPDFMILISPVISMGNKYTHLGSRNNFLGESPDERMIELYSNELKVTKDSPPSFIVHAQNDHAVSCMNSILFYEALLENNVTGSLHIFPEGDHSIALRNNPGDTNLWTKVCEAWLKKMGYIK